MFGVFSKSLLMNEVSEQQYSTTKTIRLGEIFFYIWNGMLKDNKDWYDVLSKISINITGIQFPAGICRADGRPRNPARCIYIHTQNTLLFLLI